jgi:transcriptional regulator with XRE-family HTH domain
MFPIGNMRSIMNQTGPALQRRAAEAARAFGSRVRSRRQALRMRQDQLALATGVGRRFVIDLEAGKTSCQLGRSLVVAEALGLRPTEILEASGSTAAAGGAPLPELPDEEDEANG